MKHALFIAIILSFCCRTYADELLQRESDLFETYVRPTLVNRCVKCHGEETQEAGLSLATMESMLRGGDSGTAVELERGDVSLLLSAIRHESLEMPPDGKLDESTIKGIEAWVKAGAPWPEGAVLKAAPQITDQDKKWWCYQSIQDPPVPEASDSEWCRNEIDRFILDQLRKKNLQPANEASGTELLRRVSFDLTGLPPRHFDQLTSYDPNTYGELVDKLLADPAYGEQQARYWLDLVRYADSDGYRADAERPHAKLYRDYVIRSMNNDLPYDQFILQQIAGDEVFPGNQDAIVATMYLRHWIYEHNQRDVEQQWHEILNDITETTADVFLAQGLKCARCHDHKFDPILQKDFYRMKAFFAALLPRENMPVATVEAREAFNEQQERWEHETESIRRRLYEIENPPLLAHATREGFDKFIIEIKQMVEKFPTDRGAYERQIAELASRQYDVHPDKLPEWLDEGAQRERIELQKKLAEFDNLKPSPLKLQTFVISDVGTTAPPIYINRDTKRAPTAPGFLSIISPEDANIEPAASALQSTGRRTALARWMTSPENPLVARVIVNRVWQQHFGVGLVPSSSDFGRLGTPPSHPELLDWLSSRLIEDGWSLKSLHRRIVTSATYRQTSLRAMDDHSRTVDPNNQLLWRMNPRRLSGEEILDSLLTASGEIGQEGRAIYMPVMRNSPNPLINSFDGPDRIRSVGERHRTTTSTQALLMLNSDWTLQRTAKLVSLSTDLDDLAFIHRLYENLYAREATELEIQEARQFLYDLAIVIDQQSDDKSSAKSTQTKLRSALTHVMINSNEMIYVD